MDQTTFASLLSACGLNGIKYHKEIGSTNDEALVWATANAKDMSLVFAERQTKGKGRMNREWHSQAEHSLTFSLILKPGKKAEKSAEQCAFLASLALVNTLRELDIESRIKWPNDVLIRGRKVAGVLVENVWIGATIDSVVIGVGINIGDQAFADHQNDLRYPATSVVANTDKKIDRYTFLQAYLKEISSLRHIVGTDELIEKVDEELAFLGQETWMNINNAPAEKVIPQGLSPDGRLRVKNADGEEILISVGEIERTN